MEDTETPFLAPPTWKFGDGDAVTSAQALYDAMKEQAPPLVEEFESRYASWQKTWGTASGAGEGASSCKTSSPVRADNAEFTTLIALCPKITPLVIQKLTQPSGFLAVELYNQLETNASFRVGTKDTSSAKAKEPKVGEAGSSSSAASSSVPKISDLSEDELEAMATLILDKSLERNQQVDTNVALWRAFQAQPHIALSNTSWAAFQCEGYMTLAETIGPGIIPRLMLEYYQDQAGWWHELIHEVLHGETSKSPVFFKPWIFEEWREWFERKEWEDVPKGRGRGNSHGKLP